MKKIKTIILCVLCVLCGKSAMAEQIDHGTLWGLYADDHPQYLRKDGTRPLQDDWDAGDYTISCLRVDANSIHAKDLDVTAFDANSVDVNDLTVARQIISTLATGTSPFSISSTTVNTNLNADLLDGEHAAAFEDADSGLASLAGLTYVSPSFVTMTGADTFSLDTNTYYKSGDSPTFANITDSGLTITRIPYASTAGVLVDSANLTFASPVLTLGGTDAQLTLNGGATYSYLQFNRGNSTNYKQRFRGSGTELQVQNTDDNGANWNTTAYFGRYLATSPVFTISGRRGTMKTISIDPASTGGVSADFFQGYVTNNTAETLFARFGFLGDWNQGGTPSFSYAYIGAGSAGAYNSAILKMTAERVAVNLSSNTVPSTATFEVWGSANISTTLGVTGLSTLTGGVATPKGAITLGAGATAIAATKGFHVVTGDGGGNTIATITGGADGMILRLLFVDALVVITDTDAHTANTVDLSAAFTSADDTVLTLIFDGTSWYECSRSVN